MRRTSRGVVTIYRTLAQPPQNLVYFVIDAFSEPVSLDEAAARLNAAIDHAGLMHVELGDGAGRQDYRYAIAVLIRPHVGGLISASALRKATDVYLDALRAYNAPPPSVWRPD